MKVDDKISKLIDECKDMASLYYRQKEKTTGLQRMAKLAREGNKETQEFKDLERKYRHDVTVVDFSDVVGRIVKIVEKL